MKSRRHSGWILATLLTVLVPLTSLFAQDQNSAGSPSAGNPSAGSPGNDPPARVARIQYISGEVSMQPGGVNDWVAANLNRPLTSSDRVWADKDSRAELNVGTGYLRMDSETSLTLTNVGDNNVQAQLDQGILEVTVLHLEPGEIYEIDTPNLAFTVMKPGVYRFEVRPNDDQTWVTVRKGNGQATGRGSAVKIGEGQQVRFTGQNSLQHTAYAAPSPDGFDDWVKVRDQRLNNSVSARYVAPGVIGYQDLDANGTWQVVPTYGAIWVPSVVPVGWAPYRFGSWVWVAPWGWTWVDNAAWGFAPFHYGRWVFAGGVWGWSPGPVFVGWRPFFAPALVGWVGGSGWGFGVSFGFGFGGGFGWFPLGWGEPFYPWYRGSRGGFVSSTYIRNVNVTNTHITNVTNITNNYYKNAINNTHYVNRNVAGAVTAASRSAIASGQNIAKAGTVVPRSELGRGQVVRNIDVSPTKAAILGGSTPRNTAIPPRSAVDRSVATRTPPARQANPSAEAHNVPQAPASLGARNPNSAQSAGIGQTANQGAHATGPNTPVRQAEALPPAHSVPRPPERTAGASTPTASGNSSQTGSSHVVPKPPYAGGPAPHESAQAERTSSGNQSAHVTQPPHQSTTATRLPASSTHSDQPSKQKETRTTKEEPKGNPGMASAQTPRPPAGYSYHAAPAYSGSSYAGNNSSYGGSARSYSAPATGYRSSGGYNASSAPTYRAGSSYGAAPTYSARATAPAMPHYSAPSAPHYSGGSSGGGHSSGGGGGSSHASSGHSGGHGR